MRAASGKSRGEVRRPLSGMRKIIAARMKQSLNDTAQLNHKMDVDMTEALRLREQFKSEGIKVSFNDIVIRAAAQALTEFPEINVSIDGSEIVVKEYVNIGVAVALENGLIVPVIRDADLMNLPQIASSARDLASRAKENRLAPDEYTGGTFTVTNLGMFDVDSFTAIINPPEAAILAVGRINKKPVVVGEDIVIRPIMNLCLTYDHMAVDGAPAARFLRRIKALLESPGLMI